MTTASLCAELFQIGAEARLPLSDLANQQLKVQGVLFQFQQARVSVNRALRPKLLLYQEHDKNTGTVQPVF